MHRRIRDRRSFSAGMLFLGCGVLGVVVAAGYPFGALARIGPGFFPVMVGVALGGLGLLLAGQGLRHEAPPPGRWAVRPLVTVLGAVLVFAGLIEPAGLAVSTLASTGLGSLASGELSAGESAALAGGLTALVVGVFVYALGLPLSVWPPWIF